MMKKDTIWQKGFTLVELLVVISIIGILVAVSIFGLANVRESSRDARRKSDLELIRSAIELYKADCNEYPSAGQIIFGSTTGLWGDGSTTGCATTNQYMGEIPNDPISTASYLYALDASGRYELCASLEQGSVAVTCGGSNDCGAETCNYKVTVP